MQLPKNQSSSMLPPNVFVNNDTKMLKTGKDSLKSVETDLYKKTGLSDLPEESSNLVSEIDRLPNAKGALPEGFFDNKDADLCVLGIKPVKLDIKDEYKEFEKLIQEDLQEVDDRFEEEEIDAAETIEEAESVEQKTYWEKVEMLKKKKLELQVARPVKRRKASEGVAKESRHEESSSDDDSGENFAVDWRAQHL
nr:hypothetical protein CFP56_12627 [Quercus suber]